MDLKILTKIFKALSIPNRPKLYRGISKVYASFFENCYFVYKISKKLNIGTPSISHHLKEF